MSSLGAVAQLRTHPVKAMQGHNVDTANITESGIHGDRVWGVIDSATGRIASGKRPRWWRQLLTMSAQAETAGRHVRITCDDGTVTGSRHPDVHHLLSRQTKREVRLEHVVPAGTAFDRDDPEAVLEAGLEATVDSHSRPLGGPDLLGNDATTSKFVDFAPLHIVTTTTMRHLDRLHPSAHVDVRRYRPNIAIDPIDGFAPFGENEWIGETIHIGAEVAIEVVALTPRCAVPTLAHGTQLPTDPDALRIIQNHNHQTPITGLNSMPCLGAYAVVRGTGAIAVGDRATRT